MTSADLPSAVAWLDAHTDFEAQSPNRQALPTLDRIRELMKLTGAPHEAYPSIHITGTNGKGSTAAMATALIGAMGLSVGTYTSPNLSRVNERIARNGEPIDDDAFCTVLESLRQLEELMDARPTRFELLTAAAFVTFADEAVDVAVIEVGLGGRWDCTNVVDGDVCVLTNVSFDHTEVLGPTLEDIARDKSGIFKEGSRVVIGERDPFLVALLHNAAERAGAAEVQLRDRDFSCPVNRLAVGGRLIDVITPLATHRELLLPLHGAHQGDNASCALSAVEALFGSALSDQVVAEAFGALVVPGRLEVVGRHPLVVVDGAHNVAGMQALARALAEEFIVDGTARAIVGMLVGRDPVAMLEPLRSAGVREVTACMPDSPRALPAETVAESARALGMTASVVEAPADALTSALAGADPADRLVVCGSLYVVADARRVLPGGPS